MALASGAKARLCFLPSRASVSGQAKRALREALRLRAGQTFRQASNQPIRLYLHPRDARLLALKPMPLSGAERLNAIRSQLEASLLEDIDRLVVAMRFEAQRWTIALCRQNWIESLSHEAKALGIRIEGIWPGQCLMKDRLLIDGDHALRPAESIHVEMPWPPEGGQSSFTDDGRLEFEARLNLLDALVLQGNTDAWAAVTSSSSAWGRRIALRLAQARWSLRHAPKGALRRPLVYVCLTLILAGLCLQVDSWMLQSRVESLEGEVAAIFKETMPAQTVMVDPVVQLQRALDQRRQSPLGASATAAQADPLAGMLLMQRALSRAGGARAAEAVQMIEWTGTTSRGASSSGTSSSGTSSIGAASGGAPSGGPPTGGMLSLRWKPSAIDQQSLRPIVQDLASRGGWAVQWGSPEEGMMQWRSALRPASSS